MKMKKKIMIVWICLSLFFLIDTVASNPLPLTNYGSGAPIVSQNTSIQFISENIIYEINENRYAQVSASYVFQNPTNKTREQVIALPFKVAIPKEIQLFAGSELLPFSYSNVPSLEFDGQSYAYTFSSVTFEENETITVRAVYSEMYSIPSEFFDNPFFNSKSCTYLAKTGSSWNNTINATFTFKIKNNLFPLGFDGFDVTNQGGYVVASKSFTNWIPDRDITVTWTTFNVPCLLGVIVPIIVIVTIFIIWRKKKKNSIPAEKK